MSELAASTGAGWLELLSLEVVLAVGFVGALIFHREATIYKFKLYTQAAQFVALSKDMKWPTPTDAQLGVEEAQRAGTKVERKTLVFLRHGESAWNDTFNKSLNPIYFVPRLLYALAVETYLLVVGRRDSWFYDSPLSDEGREQAEELRRCLAAAERGEPQHAHAGHKPFSGSAEILRALVGSPSRDDNVDASSVVVSSPLRRCLSTASVALYSRLGQRSFTPLVVLPELQEISKNPDTLALTPPRTAPEPSWIDLAQRDFDIAGVYKRADMSRFTAQKAVTDTGLKRLQSFAAWAFDECSVSTIVVSGHSFWFRFFFRTFLPRSSQHESKQLKVMNGGLVQLELCRSTNAQGVSVTWIDEASITVLHGKFVP